MREPRGGQIYKVDREFRTSRRALNVLSVRVRTVRAGDLIYLPSPGLLARIPRLVLQRIQRRRESTTTVGEHGAGVGVHRHDGRTAEQAAVLDAVAHALADGGNHADGRGLVVDDADGHLVGDDAGDGLDRGVAGDGDHVQANGAHAGHGLELLERKRTGLDGGDHAGVLGRG